MMASDPPPLEHRAVLEHDSAILPEVIAARGSRTATAKADLRRLGFSCVQDRVPANACFVHRRELENIHAASYGNR